MRARLSAAGFALSGAAALSLSVAAGLLLGAWVGFALAAVLCAVASAMCFSLGERAR